MNEDEAHRKIAALTAIAQALMREVYCGAGAEDGRRLFDRQLRDDELLALALSNELGDEALAGAFSDSGADRDPAGEEVAASPLALRLEPGQRLRARVALLGHREMDDAHTLAVRAPDGSGWPLLSIDERVGFGGEVFLGRMEIDVLHQREAWSGFTTRPEANIGERIASLPEPWRKHARMRLPQLQAGIRETLASQPASPCPGFGRPAAIAATSRFTRSVAADEPSTPLNS